MPGSAWGCLRSLVHVSIFGPANQLGFSPERPERRPCLAWEPPTASFRALARTCQGAPPSPPWTRRIHRIHPHKIINHSGLVEALQGTVQCPLRLVCCPPTSLSASLSLFVGAAPHVPPSPTSPTSRGAMASKHVQKKLPSIPLSILLTLSKAATLALAWPRSCHGAWSNLLLC